MKQKKYRLITGTAPFVITGNLPDDRVAVRYLMSGIETDYPRYRLVPYDREETEEMAKPLYQVKGKDEYGVLLTTNSQGQLVLEMKGGDGKVAAFHKNDVEKVMPYTFAVKYYNRASRYEFLGKAGDVEVDDCLLQEDGGVARVVAIDTKSPKASKYFAGWKIPATRLTSEASDDDYDDDVYEQTPAKKSNPYG